MIRQRRRVLHLQLHQRGLQLRTISVLGRKSVGLILVSSLNCVHDDRQNLADLLPNGLEVTCSRFPYRGEQHQANHNGRVDEAEPNRQHDNALSTNGTGRR